MRLLEWFHSVATGPRKRRERLTPLGLTVFGGSLAVVILGGPLTDGWLGLPSFPQGRAWMGMGFLILLLGSALCGWCVVHFLRAKGTPVPLNPPEELLQSGPYGSARNPMLAGVFLALFGVGILLQSLSMVLFWVPGYVLVHILELKLIEEPELEKRFGARYIEYRNRVPMFFPRLRQKEPSGRSR